MFRDTAGPESIIAIAVSSGDYQGEVNSLQDDLMAEQGDLLFLRPRFLFAEEVLHEYLSALGS